MELMTCVSDANTASVIWKALDASNWIAIIDILVTIFFGCVVVSYIGKRQTNNRATKDYFIGSLTEFSRAYDDFLINLMRSNVSPDDIKTWFKAHTMYITVTQKALKKQYKISFEKVQSANNTLKQYITDTDEFNEQYSADYIRFRNLTVTKIVDSSAEIREELCEVIIAINKK